MQPSGRASGAGAARSFDDGDERRIEAAVGLARQLVDEAAAIDTTAGRRERQRRQRLRTLVGDPSAADFVFRLTDEVTRIPVASAAADRFAELVQGADLDGLASVDRTLLRIGARVARLAPRIVMPLVTRRLRTESSTVILAAHDPAFADHVAQRRAEGMRCNINVLGEAIVGRRRGPSSARHGGRPAATTRRRLRVGEDLGDLSRHQRPGLRRHRRAGRRTAPAAVSHRRLVRSAEVRQPRHGGVPRPRSHDRRVPQGARSARVRRARRRDRAAGLSARRSGRRTRSRRVGRSASRAPRREHEDPDRQGRQPGDGERRGRAARLGTRSLPDQGRRRRQLQGGARHPVRAGLRRRGTNRRRQPQPVRHRVGARAAPRDDCSRAARPTRDRDAGRYGTVAVGGGASRRGRRDPVRTRRGPRRLPRRHRISGTPPRREHLARQLPVAPVRPARRSGLVHRRGRSVPRCGS